MAKSKHPGLTDKQKAFVEEYLVDLNATQAAIRAGYSEKTAAVIGCENLTKPNIADAVAVARQAQSERTEITADRVLNELALLGFANMLDYVRISEDGEPFINLSELTREQAAAISETMVEDYFEGRGENARQVRKVRIKFHDKKGALETIGKHLGMFKEELALKGSITLTVVYDDDEDQPTDPSS